VVFVGADLGGAVPHGMNIWVTRRLADPRQAAARVLSVAGEGTADAISRLSRGRSESLGMQDGEGRFAP
jgi:hypothetical protein